MLLPPRSHCLAPALFAFLLLPATAHAGMASFTLTEAASARIEVISFFLAVFLLSALALRWTITLTTLLLLLFTAANAGAGIGHQLGWLKSMPWIQDRSMAEVMMNSNKVRQLIVAARCYAKDKHGHYPQNLADMFIPDGCIYPEEYSKFAFFQNRSRSITPEPWLYLGPMLHDTDPADLPVIAAPRPEKNGKRIVGMNDASVEAIPEADYQQALQSLRAYLREHPSPP